MTTSIWWIRRDLRLCDNQALLTALENDDLIVPVFILDPALLNSARVSQNRLGFLLAGLKTLDEDLHRCGSALVLRRGDPRMELAKLIAELGARSIYAEPDFSPYACQRDRRIDAEYEVHWCGSPAVLPPGSVLKPDGHPYTIFTPFSRAWRARLSLPSGMKFKRPDFIPTPADISSLNILQSIESHPVSGFVPGEAEAQRVLGRFIHAGASANQAAPGIYAYSQGRDRLDQDGTSRLSPYLRFGMLSARQAAAAALEAIETAPDDKTRLGPEAWLNELIWRDYYIHILDHFPHLQTQNFRLPDIAWENDPEKFVAWRDGSTGYPVVDAAMRQLSQTGWIHNRARMIVASFLTKDLLIDWRWGEQWFMQNLIDGDPASNSGGWQWSAGTGSDAAPYFRIFNPVSQSLKHDPQAAFIRQWLPELAGVPDEFIHQPWMMPEAIQRASGVAIGNTYPSPIVDHRHARARALQAYRR